MYKRSSLVFCQACGRSLLFYYTTTILALMAINWTPAKNEMEKRFGSVQFSKLHIDTRVMNSRPMEKSTPTHPIIVPVYHSSIYKFDSIKHFQDMLHTEGYLYQRMGNPTVEAGELVINELEGGKGTLLYNSGLAAITDVFLTFLKAGDHLIYTVPGYTGTSKIVKQLLPKLGITHTFIKINSPIQAYKDAIKPNTRMIYGESPSNPMVSLLDMSEFGKLGNDKIITVLDSTFGSPCLQQPIKHGIDLSIHSCSKYIGGHSDLIAGCVTVKTVEHWKLLKQTNSMTGSTLNPSDAALLSRGLKTLALRVKKCSQNALKVAQALEGLPQVGKVHYPGLKTHQGHHIANKQMSDFGGMISFEMKDLQSAKIVVESTKLVTLALSLGAVESLLEHPATMTHNTPDRVNEGVPDGLIRLSIGIEDANDLIDDLKQAISKTG